MKRSLCIVAACLFSCLPGRGAANQDQGFHKSVHVYSDAWRAEEGLRALLYRCYANGITVKDSRIEYNDFVKGFVLQYWLDPAVVLDHAGQNRYFSSHDEADAAAEMAIRALAAKGEFILEKGMSRIDNAYEFNVSALPAKFVNVDPAQVRTMPYESQSYKTRAAAEGVMDEAVLRLKAAGIAVANQALSAIGPNSNVFKLTIIPPGEPKIRFATGSVKKTLAEAQAELSAAARRIKDQGGTILEKTLGDDVPGRYAYRLVYIGDAN